MAQNMFTYGSKREEFTDEDAKLEFERIEEELLEQMHQLELPEALSAENMMKLLDGVTPGVTQPARVINYKKEYTRFIAYAACLVLVITGFARMVRGQNDMVMKAEASAAVAFAAVEESAADIGDTESTVAAPSVMMKAAAPAAGMDSAPAEAAPKADDSIALANESLEEPKAAMKTDGSNVGELMIFVNGSLYKNNGEIYEALGETAFEGEITSSLEGGTPAKDGESNFGIGYKYRVVDENTVEVLIGGGWYRFVK